MSTPPRTFRSRHTVTAVRWTGDNRAEIVDFLGFEPHFVPSADGTWVNFDPAERFRPQSAAPGDYLVRDSKGNAFAWSYAEFHEHYAPANQPMDEFVVKRLDLRPGDAVVVLLRDGLNMAATSRLREDVSRTVPGHPVLMLPAGTDLTTVRPAPAADAPGGTPA